MNARTLGAIALAAVLPLSLAACTGKQDTPSPSPSANATSATPSGKKPSPLPSDPSFKGTPAGAKADVNLTDCPLNDGKQKAKGTIKNSSSEARDYSVMVIWMKKDNTTPYGSAITLVKDVKPGESKEFTVEGDVAQKVDFCTLNVRAGKLA